MAKRIAMSAAVFIVLLIIIISIFCPTNTLNRYKEQGQALKALSVNDINESHDCEISKDGTIKVTGEDAYIVFKNVSKKISAVKISADDVRFSNIDFQLFYTTDNEAEFSEDKSITDFLPACDDNLVINLETAKYKDIRVDFSSSLKLNPIEIYKSPAKFAPRVVKSDPLHYMLVVLLSIFITAVLALLDIKFKFYKKIISGVKIFLKNSKKRILLSAICFIAVMAISVAVEFVVSLIADGGFNIFRYVFTSGAIGTVCFLILSRKNMKEHLERVTTGLVLIIGTTMLLVSPMAHVCWDLDSHYKWALGASYYKTMYVTDSDLAVFNNADSIHIKENFEGNYENIKELNGNGEVITTTGNAETTVAHIASGIFIAVARFFGANFVFRFIIGKFAILFTYAALCYFAVKKLKSGKMILSVILLFPTNLFLASQYSYDPWVTGFISLGIACFISEMQQPEKDISVKDTILMCGAIAVGCLPKLVYAPLLILPFFMRKTAFKEDKKVRRKYLFVWLGVIAVLMVLLLIKSYVQLGSVGDIRGGTDVNPSEQLKYIFSNPFEYTKTLVNFLLGYLSIFKMDHYITDFAYLGIQTGGSLITILLFFTAFTDKNEYDRYSTTGWTRAASLVLYFGLAAVVATSLYLAYTPVGLDTVNGCQFRYLIPLLFPALVFLGSSKHYLKINKSIIYPYAIYSLISGVTFYIVYLAMISVLL